MAEEIKKPETENSDENINIETPETKKQTKKPEKAKTDKQKKSGETDKRIEELEKELDNQKNLFLRTAAEFDNYKRRTEKEKLSLTDFIKAQALKPLLPVLDNAERAAATDHNSPDYTKGVEMIIKQLGETSEKLGLIPIGEVGDTFDPNLHEAVMHIENDELPENTVAQVLQKGYKIGDTVIRPAMVQVAN